MLKGFFILREKKIKVIKQQQRLLRWKTRSGYSNPACHLSSTFWCVLQYLILLSSVITQQSITSEDLLKINLNTRYEQDYFKTFPVGRLRLEEWRYFWRQDLVATVNNTIKMDSCIQEPGGCCPWQGQEGFECFFGEFTGDIREQMVQPRKSWLLPAI